MRLHSLEAQIKEEQAATLRRERHLRDQLLREALDPQIEQARGVLPSGPVQPAAGRQ